MVKKQKKIKNSPINAVTTGAPTEIMNDTPDCILIYQGCTDTISTYKWDCNQMSDEQLDTILDDKCNSKYPGSRNIRGKEIKNGRYNEIRKLPSIPNHGFVPNCPGCGYGCNSYQNKRYMVEGTADWNIGSYNWKQIPGDNYWLVGHCVKEDCTYQTQPV